jgi:hypothetical protein
MHLVSFLVSGVVGATNGTATFVLRGTASSAASVMYNDFEGTAQPGTNVITLDANGAAEVYVNAYCDVTIKNSAGSTLRTVTVGDSATCVEVISDSFTGTGYSGSPTAVSQPITLAAVLDKWNNSAGSPDWKVTVNSVATNLSSAIAGFFGMFTNVKDPTYGATGDGVTDDTSAISAAITAAAGGTVFFPPGTYSISNLSNISTANVNLLGCGPNATIISGNSNGTLMTFTDNTAAGWKRIEGIKFTSATSYTQIFSLEESQNVYIRSCDFDGTNVTARIINRADVDGDTTLIIEGSKFLLGSATATAIRNAADDNETAVIVTGCKFVAAASFTGDILTGANFTVSGCEFDATAVTSGSYYHIDPESLENAGKVICSVTGCTFLDGGSSGFVFKLTGLVTGSNFSESGNIFKGFTEPSAATSVGNIYDISFDLSTQTNTQIHLGGRLGKTLTFSSASNALTISAGIVAENIVILSTSTASTVYTAPQLPPGSRLTISAVRNDANTRTIDFASNTGAVSLTSTNSISGDTSWQQDDVAVGVFSTHCNAAGTPVTAPNYISILPF